MSSNPSKDFWCKAESRLKQQVNLGWGVASLRRALMLAALVWGGVNLFTRLQQSLYRTEVMLFVSVGLLIAIIGYAAWTIRKRGITQKQARIRLEESLGLNSALSAAAELPHLSYPPIPKNESHSKLKWRLKGVYLSLLWSLVLGMTSQWLPIRVTKAKETYQIEKPQAIRELESNLEKLKEEGALSEESLEEVQRKIDELLSKRAEEKWFESSTMEAADHLREQLHQELKNLASKLDEAQEQLAQQPQGSKNPAQSEKAKQKVMEAMEALKKSGLQPGSDLGELAQQAMEQLDGLTEEQQKQLQEALQKNSQALQEALQSSPQFGKGKGSGDQILEEGEGGKGEDSQNQEGGPGEGGIQRGKGDAPMVLKKAESETDAAALQTVESRLDLERLAAGTAIEEKPYKPHPDEFKKPVPLEQHGGGARSGQVGSSSPVSPSFLPKEKAFLREVLK